MKKSKKTPLDFHVGQVVCIKPYEKKNNSFHHIRFKEITYIQPWSYNVDAGWAIGFADDECHHTLVRTLTLKEVGPYKKA